MKTILQIIIAIAFWGITTSLNAQSGFKMGVDVRGGYGIGEIAEYGLGIDVVGGWRFGKKLFLGVGAGYALDHHMTLINMSLVEKNKMPPGESARKYGATNILEGFVRAKFDFLSGPVSPFISMDTGKPLFCDKDILKKQGTGFILEPGIGCDFRTGSGKTLSVLLGYRRSKVAYEKTDARMIFGDAEAAKSVVLTDNIGQITFHFGIGF